MYIKFNSLETLYLHYLAKQYRHVDISYSDLISIINESDIPANTSFEIVVVMLSKALRLMYGKPLTNHNEEKQGFKIYRDYKTINELLHEDAYKKKNFFPC